jgi:hypothetical protein
MTCFLQSAMSLESSSVPRRKPLTGVYVPESFVHYGNVSTAGISNALVPLRFVCDIIRGIHATMPSLYSLLGPMVNQEPQQAHGFTLADNTSAWLASGCASMLDHTDAYNPT